MTVRMPFTRSGAQSITGPDLDVFQSDWRHGISNREEIEMFKENENPMTSANDIHYIH